MKKYQIMMEFIAKIMIAVIIGPLMHITSLVLNKANKLLFIFTEDPGSGVLYRRRARRLNKQVNDNCHRDAAAGFHLECLDLL